MGIERLKRSNKTGLLVSTSEFYSSLHILTSPGNQYDVETERERLLSSLSKDLQTQTASTKRQSSWEDDPEEYSEQDVESAHSSEDEDYEDHDFSPDSSDEDQFDRDQGSEPDLHDQDNVEQDHRRPAKRIKRDPFSPDTPVAAQTALPENGHDPALAFQNEAVEGNAIMLGALAELEPPGKICTFGGM